MANSDPQSEEQFLLVLRRLRDLPEALVCDSVLDSAGIDGFLADEHTIRMDWFWSNLLGGVKLCIRNSDAEAASSLLDQAILEKFDVDGIGEYLQPRCPNCRSLEISFQGLNKAVDYTRALFGGPRPLHRSLWQYDSCGHQWPESSEKPPANFLVSASSILLIVMTIETGIALAWVVIDSIRFGILR